MKAKIAYTVWGAKRRVATALYLTQGVVFLRAVENALPSSAFPFERVKALANLRGIYMENFGGNFPLDTP